MKRKWAFWQVPYRWGSWKIIHTLPCGRNQGPRKFSISLKLCILWGRGDEGKVELFLLPSPMNPNSYFFFSSVCWSSSCENLDFHIRTLLHVWLYKIVFPVTPGLRLSEARAGSWATADTTVWTETSLPFISCICGWDSSWVPWHIVLSPTPPSKTGLSVDGCQISVVGSGTKTMNVLCLQDPMFSGKGLKSILSNTNITSPAFFWLPFSWNIIFHPYIFSLCFPLKLKLVSYRKHKGGSCIFIHASSLCLLLLHLIYLHLKYFCW